MTQTTPGTPTWLRTRNDRTAFRLILEHGPLSRSRLSKVSGMSKPTAGQMISRLEQAGLLEPVGENTGARGPNAVLYGVRRTVMTGVAVNILGTAIEATATDPVGAGHPIVTLPVAGEERSPEADVRRAIDAACAAAGLTADSVSVVAIGVQAAFDARADELSLTDTLPGWPRIGARARLQEATGMTVILDNDVNLAAIAERASGAVGDADGFAYLWLGEGLGVGIDAGGTIQRGNTGGAGEIGYLEVPRSAAALDSEAMDFTDLLGRDAIVRLLGGVPGSALSEVLPASLDDLPVLDEVAARVALLTGPIVALLDPGIVVLGGPTGIAGGRPLADRVQQRLDATTAPRRGVDSAYPTTRIGTAAVVERPVLVGAERLLVAHIRAELDRTITGG